MMCTSYHTRSNAAYFSPDFPQVVLALRLFLKAFYMNKNDRRPCSTSESEEDPQNPRAEVTMSAGRPTSALVLSPACFLEYSYVI